MFRRSHHSSPSSESRSEAEIERAEEEIQRNFQIEHQCLFDVIKLVPMIGELTLPNQSDITLSHITGPTSARAIMRMGFMYPIISMRIIDTTTTPLARPGHEVANTWPEEVVRGFNTDILAGQHKGGNQVVIIRYPSPENDLAPTELVDPSTKFGENIRMDYLHRLSLLSSLTESALDEIFLDKTTLTDIHIPPQYIYGVVNRDDSSFYLNPQFGL